MSTHLRYIWTVYGQNDAFSVPALLLLFCCRGGDENTGVEHVRRSETQDFKRNELKTLERSRHEKKQAVYDEGDCLRRG